MRLGRPHYENLTNPSPRLSRMTIFKLELKKLFSMKNFHKFIMTIIVISFLGVLYSGIAGIWGLNFGIININWKIIGTFIIIFIISLLTAFATFGEDWECVQDMFDFDYD